MTFLKNNQPFTPIYEQHQPLRIPDSLIVKILNHWLFYIQWRIVITVLTQQTSTIQETLCVWFQLFSAENAASQEWLFDLMTDFRCKEAEQDTIDSTKWIVTNRLNKQCDYFNPFKSNILIIKKPTPWSSINFTSEAYSVHCQTSKMELLAKIVNGWKRRVAQ